MFVAFGDDIAERRIAYAILCFPRSLIFMMIAFGDDIAEHPFANPIP